MGKLRCGAALCALLAAAPALAQTQQTAKVSTLVPATTPFSGAELFYIIQGGISKKVSLSTLFTAPTFINTIGVGGGAPLSGLPNTPSLVGSSQFIPSSVTTTATPVLGIERSTTYSTGGSDSVSSPTLWIGTVANISSGAGQTAWVDGIDSEELIASLTTVGGNAFEAIRGRAVSAASVVGHAQLWGGSFIATQTSGAVAQAALVGVESEVDDYFADAAAPSASWNPQVMSYYASSGNFSGAKISDAAFTVNPNSTAGFQAGFACPREQSGAGTVVRYSCFVSAETTTYGIDLHLGTYVYAINATGFTVDNTGVASTTQILLSTAGSSYITATNTNSGGGTSIHLQANNGTAAVDSLIVTSAGLIFPVLPTSGGSGGLPLCRDAAGTVYTKNPC